MKMSADVFYHKLENDFKTWAEAQEDILAAFILGSRVRKDHPADQWSDLDIILAAKDINKYTQQTDWVEKFGSTITCLPSRTAGNDPELLVLYEEGYQVDYVMLPLETLQRAVAEAFIPEPFHRGVKLLFDKDGSAAKLLPSSFEYKPCHHINEADFRQAVQWFWFTIHYTTRQLLRKDLWFAKSCEIHIRGQLLKMLEWYAIATHEETYDIWHAGRFMKDWLDAETYEELKSLFSSFDISESINSLMSAIRLYRRLALTIAQKLNFTYPQNVDEKISNWIDDFRDTK